jgi:hypothetical protein
MRNSNKLIRVAMSRFRTVWFVLFIICLTALNAYANGQEFMNVQVKNGQVRTSPSFLGKVVANLRYGDQILVLEKKEGWFRISQAGRGIQGWMHGTALTTKKIVLSTGNADVQKYAGSGEVALAGKGFNKQVEAEFRSRNPNMNFTWIDKMEAVKISPYEMQEFLKQGEVFPKGGVR